MPEPNSFHHGNLREAALKAALDTVENDGSAALNLRAVAERCGVDHSALYRHFASKDELIAAVIARGYTQLIAAGQQSSSKSPAGFLEAYARFGISRPRLYRLMFSDVGGQAILEPTVAKVVHELIQLSLLRLAPQAASGNTHTAARDRVIRAWALVHGLISLWHAGLLRAATEEAAIKYICRQIVASETPFTGE